MTKYNTRFAPSPNGYLHLGHVYSAKISQKIAENSSGKFFLRIENIDVGGPTMVRADAKNYNDVAVITSSKQYGDVIDEIEKNKGSTSLNFRERMSLEAFSETAYYDALISGYFNKITNNHFPKKKVIYGNLIETLRYGENPHQEGAIYSKSQK